MSYIKELRLSMIKTHNEAHQRGQFMKYSKHADLKSFLKECEKEILNDKNKIAVNYPDDVIKHWNSDRIKTINKQLLKNISRSANVYAIFISDKSASKYDLVYIGQTNSKGARTRLTNHLIKKHEKTGAKLNKVTEHIQAGGKLKISWISIEPVSLRHYVEEELIKKHKDTLAWNKYGK